MSYSALHVHSHFSLLDGLSKPWQIAARAAQLKMPACAITDHGSISGAVAFLKAMKDTCKNCGYQPNQHANSGKGRCTIKGVKCEAYEKQSTKAILGNEFYISQLDSSIKSPENRSLSHLCVLAKNLKGWKNLIKATSASNNPSNFYYKPRLNIEKLAAFAEGQWIVFSGHPGSTFANTCFTDIKSAYASRTYEEVVQYVKPWEALKIELLALAKQYQELFGKENFFIEVQLIDAVNLPAAQVLGKIMRWLGKEANIECVATPDAHYPESKDAEDQRILLCSNLDCTLSEAEAKLAKGEEFGLSGFFRSNKYHIPSYEEMTAIHTKEEIDCTNKIAEMCESYDITSKPRLPNFECPNEMSPDDYMTELCRKGWKKRINKVVRNNEQLKNVYAERVKKELDVLKDAGLCTYFLVVADLIEYSVKIGCKKSYGRGSGAGTLVGYLLGIHDTDPIKFKLSFERFYSSSRLTPSTVNFEELDFEKEK